MRKYNRIFLIVLDSLGIGAMADSEKFGDVGVNTFGHIWESQGGLEIPNLRRLGMGNLCGVTEDEAKGYARRLNEASNGKDTMTGHWEMMGIYTTKPFVTFTDHGFPKELIDELEKRTGRKIIGNKAASGTEILDELAELTAVKKDGGRIPIIANGRFVLHGTEELNEPLRELD